MKRLKVTGSLSQGQERNASQGTSYQLSEETELLMTARGGVWLGQSGARQGSVRELQGTGGRAARRLAGGPSGRPLASASSVTAVATAVNPGN